jgi:acetyl esterase/lipase
MSLKRPDQTLFYKQAAPSGQIFGIDLYMPLDQPAHSCVVYAHGGGFSHGSRKDKTAARLATVLCDEGIAVASIDYRKKAGIDAFTAPESLEIIASQARTQRVGLKINLDYAGPRFYAALEDASDAVGYLRAHADVLGIGDCIVFLGASAGGILAMSLAFPPGRGWERLHRPDGAMSVCGAMVQPWRLSPKGPPAVMMHGYFDGVISTQNARFVANRAAAKGAPLDVIITPVRGHRQQVDAFLNGRDETSEPYMDLLRNLITKARGHR